MSTPAGLRPADERAFVAMLDHHAQLRRALEERVGALRSAVAAATPYEQPLATLTAFLADSVLPHAAVEEEALYPVAATDAAAAVFVDGMVMEHRMLAERVHALAGARAGVEALGLAEGVAAVFAVHVDKENALLLPALARTPGVSLAALLEAMHERLTGHEAGPEEVSGRTGAPPKELDVRTLPHGAGRHEAIFARLDALAAGAQLVIVNDHDPKPLHYQLDAAWPGTFDWDYLQSGPEVWRVGVTRRV